MRREVIALDAVDQVPSLANLPDALLRRLAVA
jgi:hypothetical protein